jgi:hypothetical protein
MALPRAIKVVVAGWQWRRQCWQYRYDSSGGNGGNNFSGTGGGSGGTGNTGGNVWKWEL